MMYVYNNLIDLDWWLSSLSDYVFNPLILIILCLLSVFVVLGNLLVVSAIWHEHQLHSVTNYLIASLAAADCLVGAVVMPFSIISEMVIGSWTFGEAWCDLWHSFDVLASTASIMNLCAISLDRYLAITDPISYPSRMTPKRVALLIVSLWTCSSLISFPAILWWRAVGEGPLQQFISPPSTISPYNKTSTYMNDITPIDEPKVLQYKCVFTDDPYYLLFSSFISFYGPLCVMLYAYYRIYKAAVQQTRFLKYGSKQVIIGRSKKKKRSRNISEHSSIGNNEKNKYAEENCDGLSNMQSYDRQHLVLRVHRGGGGAGSATTKGSVSDMHGIKTGSDRRKRENQNTDPLLPKSDRSTEDEARGAIHRSRITTGNIDHSKNECQQQLLNRQPTQSISSNRVEFINRNNSGSSRRDRLRVVSQRFDSKQPDNISIEEGIQTSLKFNETSNESSCISHKSDTQIDSNRQPDHFDSQKSFGLNRSREQHPMQTTQQLAKPLLAYINHRSTSVDVSIIDNTDPTRPSTQKNKVLSVTSVRDQCLLSQAKCSTNSCQKDSSFIDMREKKDDNLKDQYKSAMCHVNTSRFDVESSEGMPECDTLSSSSGSYGTGSIASVMYKPETFQKRTGDDQDHKFECKPGNNRPEFKSKRALSFGEAYDCELSPRFHINEAEDEDVFISSLDLNDSSPKRSNMLHRASCGDPTSYSKAGAMHHGYASRAAKSLNIRSWVKLTKTKASGRTERLRVEDKFIKPPPSLMPLMMMNSDTSTDSSIVSSVIKQSIRKERTPNCPGGFNANEPTDSINIENVIDDSASEISIKQQNLSELESEKSLKDLNEYDDKNLSSIENSEEVQAKRSDDVESKSQMLYYNSEKLIHSIVDLSAIHYIDCVNHTSKDLGNQKNECRVEIVCDDEKLESDPSEQVQQTEYSRASHAPRQQRGVGKKLSKLAKERKAAKTLGIVVGVFILCWLPFFVVNIVVAICGANCIYRLQLFFPVVTWLGWLNSAMNPVIYACWSRDFRRAFRRVLCSWVEFVCPYDGGNLARKLKLKKSSNFTAQEAFLNRTASSIKGNTSSATIRSVGVSTDGRVLSSMNGKTARNLISDQ